MGGSGWWWGGVGKGGGGRIGGGGSNLILGTGMKSQIFILRTPATVRFFFAGLSKNDIGIILQTLTHP